MKRILIIDDEAEIVAALEEILTDEGYEVATATQGREGLAEMEKRRPDLVLLDLMMPVMDGATTLKAMETREEWRGVPVVLMSAGGQDAARRSGERPFLAKPFDLTQLFAMIDRTLN